MSGSNNGNWFGDVPDCDNTVIGALVQSSITNYTDAYISRILVYNRQLKTNEIRYVTTQLQREHRIL